MFEKIRLSSAALIAVLVCRVQLWSRRTASAHRLALPKFKSKTLTCWGAAATASQRAKRLRGGLRGLDLTVRRRARAICAPTSRARANRRIKNCVKGPIPASVTRTSAGKECKSTRESRLSGGTGVFTADCREQRRNSKTDEDSRKRRERFGRRDRMKQAG